MRGIVSVLSDLPLNPRLPDRRNLVYGALLGPIAKNRQDRLKPTRIAEPREDIPGISPRRTIRILKQMLQFGKNARVIRIGDRFARIELPEKKLFALELPDQFGQAILSMKLRERGGQNTRDEKSRSHRQLAIPIPPRANAALRREDGIRTAERLLHAPTDSSSIEPEDI